MKRFLSFFVTLILVSSVASALAESYNIVDIYEDRVPIFDIVLNAGDRITGKSGVTITLTFSDADGNSIGTSTGAIKTFTINGKQCSSWRVVGSSSSAITINNNMRGSFAYKLKPSYTAADDEGYYLISEDTYSSYINNRDKSLKKKVKFSGKIIAIDGETAYLSVTKNAVVAITASDTVETALTVDGRFSCKGEVKEYIEYNKQMIPAINCTEITEQKYEPLQRGDTGAAVLEMKERLQALGYYGAGAEFSDRYNDLHVECVKKFQKRNGLPQTGKADIETLTRLYSSDAIANN